jgi:hypothetical protein
MYANSIDSRAGLPPASTPWPYYGIRVLYAGKAMYLSWLESGIVALNPDVGAAMRFGTQQAAERLMSSVPPLADCGYVVPISRPYCGVGLFARDEQRLDRRQCAASGTRECER